MRGIGALRRRRCSSVGWPESGTILALAVLAGVLRFYALGRVPPGLYHDEAFNGLDALGVLGGRAPLFFEANNGREPLFIYLVSLSVAALGRTPGAIRLVAALTGTITVPVTYCMAREMFGRRVALWAAIVLAITVWPLNLSRTGFRAVTMPLFTGLTVWWLWRGFRSRRHIDIIVAGMCYGLAFYTYLAARFTLVALAAYGLYAAYRCRWTIPWRQVILFVVVASLVAVPLVGYLLSHWDVTVARGAQVSITNPAINGGDLWGALARHMVRGALAFTHRGDFIPRHNVPLRPVFDWLVGVAFVVGLVVSVSRATRGKSQYAFLLLWVAIMWAPTVLAEDTPHFLRGVGVLPLICVIPAVGLEESRRTIARRTSRMTGLAAVALVLAFSFGSTWKDYFVRHGASEEAYYEFETGAVEMATTINNYLGTGWKGEGIGTSARLGRAERQVYLTRRLWEDWASVRYLVTESDQLTILRGEEDIPPESHLADDVMLVLWPFEEPSAWLRLLPPGSVISVREGALERGDLDEQARLLYVVYLAEADALPEANLGREFEGRISLLGAEIAPLSGDQLRVRLAWQAAEPLDVDYTVFVHVVRDGRMVAPGDSRPAGGYYPTTLWRAGDTIIDDHTITLPEPFDSQQHRVVVGLYVLQTMERLQLLDDTGRPAGDHVEILMAIGQSET